MIIHLLVKNPSKGELELKIFDQGLGLFETFLESVPSVFIITVIWLLTTHGDNSASSGLWRIIFNPQSTTLTLLPSLTAEIEFYTKYAISIFSASLGLAKCLKNGVARPIAPGGPLDGFLTRKFVVAFLASAGALVAKCLCIGFTTVSHILYILSLLVKTKIGVDTDL